MSKPLIFLNSHRAKSGSVDGRRLLPDCVLLSRFFGCGPIDRTRTLDIGVDYEVVQEIPKQGSDASFAEICERVADDLVSEAVNQDLPIQVAWSGGIDSTVALLALKARLEERGELDRLIVLLSLASMIEYPRLYQHLIVGQLRIKPLRRPLPEVLRDDVLTITGEHGDQIFGSDHLASLIKNDLAHLPYRHVIPFYIASKVPGETEAERVMDYLAPQIAAAPVSIKTAFDYLWWCNYSLKWQQVAFRIPAFRGPAFHRGSGDKENGDIRSLWRTTRHFFADSEFQAWSLSNPQIRTVRDWKCYKQDARKVILEATGDTEYCAHKEKMPSLKGVLVDRAQQGRDRYRVHMYSDFRVHCETFRK